MITIISMIFLGVLLFPSQTWAICPLCLVAVGAGLGLSSFWGVDPSIVGIWLGALNYSLSIITIDWLKKKDSQFFGSSIFIFILYYLTLLISLYVVQNQSIQTLFSNILFIKLCLGIATGSLGLYFGANLHILLRARHSNQSYFPFQKITLAVAITIISSILFYILML